MGSGFSPVRKLSFLRPPSFFNMVYSIYFITIKNLSRSHYSDWYSHWDLVGIPSIQKSHLLGCLSCLIEQWHIFYWSVLLGFAWALTNISQLWPTPPPPPLPPRHPRRSLVSPPRPCLSNSTGGVVRVSCIHSGAWGEVSEEPTMAVSSPLTLEQLGSCWIPPVNPTCLPAWSSPASTHLIKYTLTSSLSKPLKC